MSVFYAMAFIVGGCCGVITMALAVAAGRGQAPLERRQQQRWRKCPECGRLWSVPGSGPASDYCPEHERAAVAT